MESTVLFWTALIAVLGCLGQWVSWKLSLPSIVVLSLFGLIVGPFTGWFHPETVLGDVYRDLVEIAVAVILFEGGLHLKFHEIRYSNRPVIGLVFLGVPVAFCLTLLFGHLFLSLSWPTIGVMSAILVLTGPTVILPLVRHNRLKRDVSNILKWEGIINDPIAALLAIGVFEWVILSGEKLAGLEALFTLVKGIGVGLLIAWVLGRSVNWLLKGRASPEFLKLPYLLGLALFSFAIGNMIIEGSGLLAATFLGIMVGNEEAPRLEEIERQNADLSLLLISMVFIVLAAQFDLGSLPKVTQPNIILFLLALIFLVRPLTVIVGTSFSSLNWREKFFLSAFAPRGIVAVTLATGFALRLEDVGVTDADEIRPLVFMIVLSTVLIYGSLINPVARKLGISHGQKPGLLIIGISNWTVHLAKALESCGVHVLLVDAASTHFDQVDLKGVKAIQGEVLSETFNQLAELSVYSHVIAATEHDAYNCLVTQKLMRSFPQGGVFQLATKDTSKRGLMRISSSYKAEFVFEDDVSFEWLENSVKMGGDIHAVKITKHNRESFHEKDKRWIPLINFTREQKLVMKHPQRHLKLKEGDCLIYLELP